MKCPKDGTALQRVEVEGVVLDKCHTCDGIWCDNGEIGRLKELQKQEAEGQIEQRYGDPRIAAQEVTAYMICPACGQRLHRYRYTYARDVMVDRCRNTACYGIWLDKGELDAVLDELRDLDALSQHETPSVLSRALGSWLSRFAS